MSSELRRGPWSCDEDNLLIQYISRHREGRWNSLAKFAGLNRTGKSCRLRWLNYLNPDIKRGNLTLHEQLLILELHSKWGNRWSKIAQHLPGRTDNEIKNYWRTRVQKQARQLKIDSNSTKFIQAVWMERMEQGTSETSETETALSEQTLIPQLSDVGTAYPDSSLSELPVNIGSLVQFENSVEDDQYYDFSECHAEGVDWVGEDLRSSYWNTDELWQFRKREDFCV